ncbi:hypothetical protein J7L65_02730 [Candidatus Bathyarchaeota archaeon]|nr:hypothetical protein [Candidatus Bathyarchaeota archaeon]
MHNRVTYKADGETDGRPTLYALEAEGYEDTGFSQHHLKLLKVRRFEDEILTGYLRLQSLESPLKAGEPRE